MDASRILMVVTSADRMGTHAEPTGLWLEEFAAPYYVFTDLRYEVTVASPKGGAAPLDPRSNDESVHSASTRRFEADADAEKKLSQTLKLSELNSKDFDAVFFAGGHGTMEDFANDASVKVAVEAFYHAGKPVGLVCHGPAALVNATKKSGEPLVKGKRFTCFTNEEEAAVGLTDAVPFALETRLRMQGGIMQPAAAFESHAVADGLLITGQNPASSIPVAEAMIHQLRQSQAA